MKERIKKWGLFLKKNWYASIVTVACFAMGGGAPSWTGMVLIFLIAFVLMSREIIGR